MQGLHSKVRFSSCIQSYDERACKPPIVTSRQYDNSARPFMSVACRPWPALLCIGQIKRSRDVLCALPSSANKHSRKVNSCKAAKQTINPGVHLDFLPRGMVAMLGGSRPSSFCKCAIASLSVYTVNSAWLWGSRIFQGVSTPPYGVAR